MDSESDHDVRSIFMHGMAYHYCVLLSYWHNTAKSYNLLTLQNWKGGKPHDSGLRFVTVGLHKDQHTN